LPQLRSEFDLLNEMMRAVSQGLTPPLTGLRDVRLLIRRAVIGSVLSVDDLRDLAETLLVTGAIYRWRSRLDERHVQLLEYSASIQDLGTVARVIQACIDSRGHVLDLASPELARIRQQLSELDERVKTAVNRLLRDPELRKILRFPNPTVVGDHYVLAIAANHRQRFPGVVHRSSGSGETLFVEPAAVAGLSLEALDCRSSQSGWPAQPFHRKAIAPRLIAGQGTGGA
jgi:DNA mismatch repair protein MutS2